MSKKDRSIDNMRSEAQRIYYQRQQINRLEQENKQLKDQQMITKEEIKMILCCIDLIIQNFGDNDELETLYDKLYNIMVK